MSNVLIVEDSQVDKVLMEGLLKRDPALRVRSVVNGQEAITMLEEFRPSLIITDLHLPDINGLELVAKVRLAAPQVPVILVTAFGHENMAMQALEQGASSYVPKSQLAEHLLSTARHVLEMAESKQNNEQLTQSMDYAEFGFSFGAESGPMQSLVDMVRQLVVRMNTCNQGSQVRLGIALEEALQFMQWRGSFEFSPEQFQQVAMKTEAGQRLLTERQTQAPWNIRKLQVTCRVDTQEVNVTIRHDGPPFAMPQMPMLDDAPELELASNRSVVLFSSLLQKVVFNSENRSLHLLYRK